MMECLGLLLISGTRVFLVTLSVSTGDTAMLARRPGLVAADRVPLVCGEDAALRDARRRRDEVLRWSIPPVRDGSYLDSFQPATKLFLH